MNSITELNNLIYTGAKLVGGKVEFPLKNKIRKSKPGWEIRLEKKDKKSATTSKHDKTEEKYEMLGRRGKSNSATIKDTTRRDKSEGKGERRRTKKIPRQDQKI